MLPGSSNPNKIKTNLPNWGWGKLQIPCIENHFLPLVMDSDLKQGGRTWLLYWLVNANSQVSFWSKDAFVLSQHSLVTPERDCSQAREEPGTVAARLPLSSGSAWNLACPQVLASGMAGQPGLPPHPTPPRRQSKPFGGGWPCCLQAFFVHKGPVEIFTSQKQNWD